MTSPKEQFIKQADHEREKMDKISDSDYTEMFNASPQMDYRTDFQEAFNPLLGKSLATKLSLSIKISTNKYDSDISSAFTKAVTKSLEIFLRNRSEIDLYKDLSLEDAVMCFSVNFILIHSA